MLRLSVLVPAFTLGSDLPSADAGATTANAGDTANGAGAGAGAGAAPIMDFRAVRAPAARFGRVEPSRHNLSAPDIRFHAFVATPEQRPVRATAPHHTWR